MTSVRHNHQRDYVPLHRGSCYRGTAWAHEVWFFSCTRCGAPAFQCQTCARICETHNLTATTCAGCSLADEMAHAAS